MKLEIQATLAQHDLILEDIDLRQIGKRQNSYYIYYWECRKKIEKGENTISIKFLTGILSLFLVELKIQRND
jgi:hypothetical protein